MVPKVFEPLKFYYLVLKNSILPKGSDSLYHTHTKSAVCCCRQMSIQRHNKKIPIYITGSSSNSEKVKRNNRNIVMKTTIIPIIGKKNNQSLVSDAHLEIQTLRSTGQKLGKPCFQHYLFTLGLGFLGLHPRLMTDSICLACLCIVTKQETCPNTYPTVDTRKVIQSTLVISNSKGPAEALQDICTSTYQMCRTEENIKRTTKFHK